MFYYIFHLLSEASDVKCFKVMQGYCKLLVHVDAVEAFFLLTYAFSSSDGFTIRTCVPSFGNRACWLKSFLMVFLAPDVIGHLMNCLVLATMAIVTSLTVLDAVLFGNHKIFKRRGVENYMLLIILHVFGQPSAQEEGEYCNLIVIKTKNYI